MKKINENFSVIILVGGQGSRFSKKEAPPKHLSKLNKNLILVNIINYLKKFGFRHFIFPLGYKKEYFVEFFNSNYNQKNFNFKILKKKVDISDLKSKKLSISFFDAGKNTSKMTRIFKSKKYSNSNLLIVYGDDLANVNLDKIKDLFFANKKKKAIVSVYKKNSQYGHLKINKKNEVTKFIEKPPHPLPINIGFYMMSIDTLCKFYRENYELETDFLPQLAKKKMLISCEHRGYFYSINDKKELLIAKKKLKNL